MSAPTHNEPQDHAAPATSPARPTHWLDTFFKFAAAVAVDHTHLLPLDRVSGRTGYVAPMERKSACGCC